MRAIHELQVPRLRRLLTLVKLVLVVISPASMSNVGWLVFYQITQTILLLRVLFHGTSSYKTLRQRRKKNGYSGGGVLIDQYFVLTAAHKITNLTNVNVILGVYNSSNLTNTQTSKVSSIYIHSNYDGTVLKNDIALLMLESPINFNADVNAICLPAAGKSFQNTSTGCIVSGFGQTNFALDDAPTVIMKQVHVPIVDTNVCQKSFSDPTLLGSNVDLYLDVQNEICAGGQAGKDACTQDGGSPLTCYESASKKSNLAGLVIWGKKCGQTNVYGVYVNVPSYASWIQCTQLCMVLGTSCASCPAKKK
ncbi:hypothetical protein NQ318_000553 [Aromia moschata]|uniref:Peptidase S1 domain-containing protein n=1 Tax=Aromia moschata TaxID=1265417 RepID=A0AAV8XWY4_9CUCU|nr:hypothetical protein NQ318_000553 [Aromia moschata]